MKAVITAAGYGTRMLPITKTVPKEMLPVGNKPVIQYIVEGLVGANIKDIIVITSQGKQALEDYFDKNYELEEILKKKGKTDLLEEINKPKFMANYTFVKQKVQLGFPHAILEAKPWIFDDFFLLTVGDTIFHPKIYEEIIAIHRDSKKSVVALQEVPMEEVYKYGVVDVKDGKIIDMVEKPNPKDSPSNLIMVGIYILPKTLLKIIENTPIDKSKGEILLPDSLKLLMQQEDILPYITKHKVRDVGTPELWLKANMDLFNENF